MNARTVSVGILVLALAGLAYYFGFDHGWERSVANSATSSQEENSESSQQNVEGGYSAGDARMVGKWKSTEDAKFTREFRADGTIVDMYLGEESATVSGLYAQIDTTVIAVPGVPRENLAGLTVIQIAFGDDPANPMFFGIHTLTDSELHMSNLSGRGNMLVFAKVK